MEYQTVGQKCPSIAKKGKSNAQTAPEKHSAFLLRGPQRIDLLDYNSVCPFGLYVVQDEALKGAKMDKKQSESSE